MNTELKNSYMYVFCLHVYMYVCVQYECLVPWWPEEGTRHPATGVPEGCEHHVDAGD